MSLSSVILETPPRPPKGSEPEAQPFRYQEVSRSFFPVRGLVYSFVVHEAIIFAILLWPLIHRHVYTESVKRWELTMIPKDQDVLYLPELGGGSEGGGAKSGSGKASQNTGSASVATPSQAGVSYPGTQAVVSNPPNPTNRVQTILQPSLPNPPVLKTFVPLPNMVKLAEPTLAPPPPGTIEPPKPAPEAPAKPATETAQIVPHVPLPVEPPSGPPAVDAPKLSVPKEMPGGTNVPLQAMAKPPAPPSERSEARPAPIKPQLLPGAGGTDVKSLLALSPMPAPPEQAAKVPEGEARGQFAIAALPNLAMSHVGPGSAATSLGANEVGVGDHSNAAGHDAAGNDSGSPGEGAHTGVGGGKSGTGSSPGAGGSGSGTGTAGTGSGAGAGNGPGAGHGRGTGSGSGTGAGTGPGVGLFPGITIQGGQVTGGTVAGRTVRPTNTAPLENKGSYALTIVATGSSGGGLGDFGVFHEESVYTVYIDMTSPEGDPPAWTLQYAVLRTPPAGSINVSFDPPRPTKEGLEPPFPINKEMPKLPSEVLSRFAGRMMVVYAVINKEGKLEHVRIMQSSSAELNPPVLDALAKWVFRPARLHGEAVPVKALFGIPLPFPQ